LAALPDGVVPPLAERLGTFALPLHAVDVALEVGGDAVDVLPQLLEGLAGGEELARVATRHHGVEGLVAVFLEVRAATGGRGPFLIGHKGGPLVSVTVQRAPG